MNTSDKTLLQLLVEDLPKHGGWPEKAKTATQSVIDGEIYFRDRFDQLINRGIKLEKVVKLQSSRITRDQYEAALAATATTDGWIEWAGGECPVDGAAFVDYKMRSGQVDTEDAHILRWNHKGFSGDIIAYRLHQTQDANSRANDDRLASDLVSVGLVEKPIDDACRVEADLNECIGQAPCAPQWDGHGLPPVGVEFEYGSHRSRARCLAIGLHYVFASKGDQDDAERDYEELLIDIHTSYHLARSTDEIKRDADIAVLASDIDDSDEGGDLSSRQQDDIAKHLYAAGYRKQ